MTSTSNSSSEEGPRLKHLRQALHKMLQATIKSCSGSDNTEQCFPFGLPINQVNQIDAILSAELQSVYSEIQMPFEELINQQELPEKLNRIDWFMREAALRDTPAAPTPGLTPTERITAILSRPKQSAHENLKVQVEHLEWINKQRKDELADRRMNIGRRMAHVRDVQQLYEEAVGKVLGLPSGQMETCVDRMLHQTVPSHE